MPIAALLAIVARYVLALAITYAGQWILKAFLFFGVSVVTHKYVVAPFVTFIQSSLAGAPGMVIAALSAVSFDKAVTIVISAHVAAATARLALQHAEPAGGTGGGTGP